MSDAGMDDVRLDAKTVSRLVCAGAKSSCIAEVVVLARILGENLFFLFFLGRACFF